MPFQGIFVCRRLGMQFTDLEWAHIDDLLGSGPRPNVVGAWLWLTGRMEISRTTFESRLRVRRLTARSAGQAHAASAAGTEEPDGAHGHACTAAQTPAPCLAPTEDDAGGGALGPELSTASELCEDDLAGQTEPPPESSGGTLCRRTFRNGTAARRDWHLDGTRRRAVLCGRSKVGGGCGRAAVGGSDDF